MERLDIYLGIYRKATPCWTLVSLDMQEEVTSAHVVGYRRS
jgi:hypothetical protein